MPVRDYRNFTKQLVYGFSFASIDISVSLRLGRSQLRAGIALSFSRALKSKSR